jgi:hypothetical protein
VCDSYVNWADGEPNNWEEQDCVQLLPPWGHKWDDDFCNYQKKAICEKKGWKRVIESLCFLQSCKSAMKRKEFLVFPEMNAIFARSGFCLRRNTGI